MYRVLCSGFAIEGAKRLKYTTCIYIYALFSYISTDNREKQRKKIN